MPFKPDPFYISLFFYIFFYIFSYDALTPTTRECDNLLVPFVLSANHVAFGAIRMEPTFMMLSEASGTAAALAIDADVPVQKVDYDVLRSRLLNSRAVLSWD